MGRSTQIMGGSFRRGLNTDVVTFSTRLAVQPSPMYKSIGKRARWQPPVFVSCLLIAPQTDQALCKRYCNSQQARDLVIFMSSHVFLELSLSSQFPELTKYLTLSQKW